MDFPCAVCRYAELMLGCRGMSRVLCLMRDWYVVLQVLGVIYWRTLLRQSKLLISLCLENRAVRQKVLRQQRCLL